MIFDRRLFTAMALAQKPGMTIKLDHSWFRRTIQAAHLSMRNVSSHSKAHTPQAVASAHFYKLFRYAQLVLHSQEVQALIDAWFSSEKEAQKRRAETRKRIEEENKQ